MQGKGIFKFFLVIVTLVCLLQYIFLLPTQSVERDAEDYAQAKAANISNPTDKDAAVKIARVEYLDSMSSEHIFSIPMIKSYTYEDLKRQQLALGLDLKGGISTILRVDLREFLVSLSNNSKDPAFIAALDKASQQQKTSQKEYITLFADAWNAGAGDKKLATIFSINPSLRDKITVQSTNAQVISVLRQQASETVDLTFKRLKDRIDKFGVTQPNVSLDAARDLIVVELPGVDNPERARKFLQASAKLEFWDIYRVTDAGVMEAFLAADKALASTANGDTTAAVAATRKDTTYVPKTDSLGNVIDSVMEVKDVPVASTGVKGPLTSILELNTPNGQQMIAGLPVMGIADKNKKNIITEYLNREDIKKIFPADMVFKWSAKPTMDPDSKRPTTKYELYAIKKKRGSDAAPLEGDRVVDASANPDPITGSVAVSLKMDNAGAKTWGEMTTKASQDNNREIAIVLDDEVVSAPRVNDPILSGDSQISGGFSIQEGKDLANILQIGKLPAKTKIIQESLVGPSLGQENINKSLMSIAFGLLSIILLMIAYYGGGGVVAVICLVANLFFIIGTLASYGTVLTLPGIAGIALTMGVAVDANVIIYERIKEELREGKAMSAAIRDGFKHSYSAIIDANVTTILTAIILAYFGLGPIKGFAVVLIIGILFTLFTAVMMGRLIIDWYMERKGHLTFTTKLSEGFFINPKFNWIGFRKRTYIISIIVIVAGIASFFVRGFELGVDFKGGWSYNVAFDKAIDQDKIQEALAKSFEGTPIVKAIDVQNTYNITTSYMITEDGDEVAVKVLDKLYEGLNSVEGGTIDRKAFENPDSKGTHVVSSAKVGPTVADDIFQSSIWAIGLSILAICLYIFIRFKKWEFSLGAVVALLHDTLIILVVFTLFHGILPFSMEIDQAFIAAILTILGYSMNDTVVVFDRLREYLGKYSKKETGEVINAAINSTLNRTIMTSVITFLVVFLLFVFGGSSIRGFAFALTLGIVVGTYSSIFIATPIMYDLMKGKKGADMVKSASKETAEA